MVDLSRNEFRHACHVRINGRLFLVSIFFLVHRVPELTTPLSFGTTLVINGEISPGTTFAVFWYGIQVPQSMNKWIIRAVIGGTFAVGQAAPQIGVILGAKSAAAPIFEIIDRVRSINLPYPSIVLPFRSHLSILNRVKEWDWILLEERLNIMIFTSVIPLDPMLPYSEEFHSRFRYEKRSKIIIDQ